MQLRSDEWCSWCGTSGVVVAVSGTLQMCARCADVLRRAADTLRWPADDVDLAELHHRTESTRQTVATEAEAFQATLVAAVYAGTHKSPEIRQLRTELFNRLKQGLQITGCHMCSGAINPNYVSRSAGIVLCASCLRAADRALNPKQ